MSLVKQNHVIGNVILETLGHKVTEVKSLWWMDRLSKNSDKLQGRNMSGAIYSEKTL